MGNGINSEAGRSFLVEDLTDVERIAETNLRRKLQAMLPALTQLETLLSDESITFLEYIRQGKQSFDTLNKLGFPERNRLGLANHYQLVHPGIEAQFFNIDESTGQLACTTKAVLNRLAPPLVEQLGYSFDDVERKSLLKSVRDDSEKIQSLLAEEESATIRNLALELLFRHTRVKSNGVLIGLNRWERGYDPALEELVSGLSKKVLVELERPFVRRDRPSGSPEQLRSDALTDAWRTEEFARRVEANML